MSDLKRRVLGMFDDLGRSSLDLHALFEAADPTPNARDSVLRAIEELVDEDLLRARGSDFYERTERGRVAFGRGT